jgi:hypothetical protein
MGPFSLVRTVLNIPWKQRKMNPVHGLKPCPLKTRFKEVSLCSGLKTFMDRDGSRERWEG